MTIFETPAIVNKIAALDLSGPVRPIGEDRYRTVPAPVASTWPVAAYAATKVDEDRRETHAAMLDLIEQGKAGGPAYRALAARLMRLNGE